MTLLDDRDAEIVKLNRVEGLSHRATARHVKVSASTVTRVVAAFKREMEVFVGRLDGHTPTTLRDMTVAVLDRAADVRAKVAA